MLPWEDLQHERREEEIQEVRGATKEQIDRNAEQVEVEPADMTAVAGDFVAADFVAADLAVGVVQVDQTNNRHC